MDNRGSFWYKGILMGDLGGGLSDYLCVVAARGIVFSLGVWCAV